MREPEPAARSGDEAPSVARARILVIDDSALSRNFITGVLGRLQSVSVVSAESGTQGLRAISEAGISLVICDYAMPDLSGLQVLHFVRQSYSAIELPFLMLTSRDDPDVKLKALTAGANDYIAKQSQPEELLARVGTQLDLLRAHQRLSAERLRRSEHQKFEAIGYLAEGLAHELNTPAQYIQDNLAFLNEAFTALLAVITELRALPSAAEHSLIEAVLTRIEYDYVTREVPRCIVECTQGIEHVARVVAVMREFARPGLPERGTHSLNEIVKGALAVTHGQWHQVAELQLSLSDALPPVRCVGVTIKQVVLYALLNAVKAMAPRAGQSEIQRGVMRVTTRLEQGAWAVIEICDNGRGLARPLVEQLVDPVLGSQAPEDNSQGLAHARAVIVDQHHGRIDVESSSEGTSLFIRLPAQLPASDDGGSS